MASDCSYIPVGMEYGGKSSRESEAPEKSGALFLSQIEIPFGLRYAGRIRRAFCSEDRGDGIVYRFPVRRFGPRASPTTSN